ncbi:MAG TPA: DUF3037 domain-containing protein [Nitrolancea sp.]|jgi:hypothetical protein|nr:DUF3037 domain-containing protein [Nitrolancea sp.]
MPDLKSFDYATLRVVPRVEREEFVNAGVILFCRTSGFLDARVKFDRQRIEQFAPDLDHDEAERHLLLIMRICHGGTEGGPIGLLSPSERFHWLVAPRSTVIQTSPVHSGLCHDTEEMLDRLYRMTVTLEGEGSL